MSRPKTNFLEELNLVLLYAEIIINAAADKMTFMGHLFLCYYYYALMHDSRIVSVDISVC